MDNARYWTLVRLDNAGNPKRHMLEPAKTFVQQQLTADVTDAAMQQRLVPLMRSPNHPDQDVVALCLRCFLSHLIEQACTHLETQFGAYYGFTRYDLYPFVLDDDGTASYQLIAVSEQPKATSQEPAAKRYQPLALKILQTFDPNRANLSTWTVRLVKQHHELNAFLLEQGLCMLSDWAILNDTKPKKLRRVLTQFHHLTEPEVQQALVLLDSYHAVYRRDRLLQGQKGACLAPTSEQLQEIGDYVQPTNLLASPGTPSPGTILTRLTALAGRLRQYRIAVGGGKPPSQSLDQPGNTLVDELSQASGSIDEDPQVAFLQTYRPQFLGCLETALHRVVTDRVQTLKPPKQQNFLAALQLFHCQKRSMGAIAQQIGLQAQFQVSRLLKLEELRTDVRHGMLQCLRHAVKNAVLNDVAPDMLDKIDQQIAEALEEQVNDLLQKDQANAKTPKGYVSDSLFAQTLCRYLDELTANS
ncbi:MAG: hypothetical protein KME42_20880 [Tildeniella nuda ZEHNDER 1965/U140]|jgi:hypothetical protein|nr:hypothetical protein [Tildeniella nuda ZEHNDER 1965/U140]